jgi:pimeloyl-ACP methyl ester carboxylesterase
MLFMHGTDGNIACTLPWALVASANHMHAVVFDYQGFGDSEGTADIATLLDDSDAVLNWITADASPARQQVHLVGTSLGTSAALGLVTLRNQPQIRSVTLDGAWDPEAMVGGFESSVSPLFPLFDFSARTDFAWLFQMRAGLGDVTTPAMFIHGAVDDITPLAGAQTMHGLLGSSAKSFFAFEGLNHIQPLFRNRQAYISLLVTFWRDPSATPSGTAWMSDSTIRLPEFTP